MKDDKGFSLIELIVTMTIVVILVGFVGVSLGLLSGQSAKECANNISGALDKEKIYALSKSATADACVEIRQEGNSWFAVYYVPKNAIDTDVVEAERQKLGKAEVAISCTFADGSVLPLSPGQSVRISFNRVNGSYKEARAEGTVSKTDFLNKITIEKNRKYELELYSATGKHVLTRVN